MDITVSVDTGIRLRQIGRKKPTKLVWLLCEEKMEYVLTFWSDTYSTSDYVIAPTIEEMLEILPETIEDFNYMRLTRYPLLITIRKSLFISTYGKKVARSQTLSESLAQLVVICKKNNFISFDE